MSLIITSYPVSEPVTLDEIKDHVQVRLENNRFDALLESQITAARSWCEQYLSKTIVRTSYAYSFNALSGTIELPKAPVISVESIVYFNTATSPNSQTVSTDVYGVDLGVYPSCVYLKYGQTWPTSRGHRNDVTINFTAGHDDSGASPRDYDDQVPEPIKAAIKLVVGNLFLNREQKMDIQTYHNDTAEMLLDPYRLHA